MTNLSDTLAALSEADADGLVEADNIANSMASYCRKHGFSGIELTLTRDGGWVCIRKPLLEIRKVGEGKA